MGQWVVVRSQRRPATD